MLEANQMLGFSSMVTLLNYVNPILFIGDEAFALNLNMMKPYSHRSAMGDKKIFNYYLSRA